MTDVLILGSGPAGYTAAIYAARAGRKVKLLTGPQQGGQLIITSFIENYPGFAEPISGIDLMERMKKQAENVGVEMVYDTISKVDFSQRPFKCFGESAIYESKTVVIATGASAKWLGLDSEKKYMGCGVSACATCDGFFFRNKDVAVVGGGNTAVEEAIYLTNFAKSVTLIHRRDSLRAEKIMQQRLFNNGKIKVVWNAEIVDIIGDNAKVTGISLRNTKTNEITQQNMDGVFVAIGYKPATDIFAGQLNIDNDGYIIKAQDSSRTSVEGVFVAGDVCNPVYRQAVVSAAQGCMAGIDADKFISAITV